MPSDITGPIGRYQVLGEIGRGAMGVILRAHDPELDRALAIKLIARDLLSGDDGGEYTSRFQREARAASRCPHPNIVAVYDYGTHDGQPYLVMEFVEGVSLQSALAGGRRFSMPDAVHIISQILQALECAHAAGIVHRDIKPANILVLPDLRAKLADFGIARVGGSDLTRIGDMIGTPAYMSPEQCLGTAVDARADLFSLGTVLFETLSHSRAFGGGSMAEVIRRVVDGATPILPAGLESLQPVINRALQKDPAARFQSASEMAAALSKAASEAGQSISMPSPDATVIATSPINPATLGEIERSLAGIVGPIAPRMLSRALRQATSPDELLEALSQSIETEADRSRFLQSAKRSLGGSAVSAAPSEPPPERPSEPAATPADLESLRQALLPYTGPIAAHLIKRAAAGGAGRETVRQKVALHIEDAGERARFLGVTG